MTELTIRQKTGAIRRDLAIQKIELKEKLQDITLLVNMIDDNITKLNSIICQDTDN